MKATSLRARVDELEAALESIAAGCFDCAYAAREEGHDAEARAWRSVALIAKHALKGSK